MIYFGFQEREVGWHVCGNEDSNNEVKNKVGYLDLAGAFLEVGSDQ